MRLAAVNTTVVPEAPTESTEIRLLPPSKVTAPIVSVTVDGADKHTFTTVIAPLSSSRPAPALRVRRDGGPVVVEVEGVGEDSAATDTLTWDDAQRPVSFGSLSCRAEATSASPAGAW